MTRKEVIESLNNLREIADDEVIDWAIEALQAKTDGDLISREDAIKCIRWGEGVTDVIERIKALTSADVVEVVRCKDCTENRINIDGVADCWCYHFGYATEPTDFCSFGERIEDHD